MDTNRDGIIDDPLATPHKRGRKSLGLTPEETRARREAQRKERVAKEKRMAKQAVLSELVKDTLDRYEMYIKEALIRFEDEDEREEFLNGKMRGWVNKLTDDNSLIIKRTEASPLAGFNGERLRRSRG